MLRTVVRKIPIFSLAVPVVDEQKVEEEIGSAKIGWERVKQAFTPDETGAYPKEAQAISRITCMGGLVGIIIGGYKSVKPTVDNFIENNQATRFLTKKDAVSQLHWTVLRIFIENGVKFGLKVGIFTGMYTTFFIALSEYRGKYTVSNYACATGLAGMLYRLNMGIKAAITAMALGVVVGTVGGSLLIGMLKITGLSVEESIEIQHKYMQLREKKIREQTRKHFDKNSPEIKELFDSLEKTKEIDTPESRN